MVERRREFRRSGLDFINIVVYPYRCGMDCDILSYRSRRKKRIRYKKALLSNEDLLEEITDLNREVVRLNNEKERVMQLKITQAGLSYEHMKKLLQEEM